MHDSSLQAQAREIETYRGVVNPWTCDVMGHMNTRFYAEMFDTASSHALNNVMPSTALRRATWGWADVRQVIEYKAELLPGTLVACKTRFLRLGTSSVVFRHALVDTEAGTVHATSEHTVVLFDLEGRRAVPFAAEIRDRLRESGLIPE
jgi:acyl-CoA thioester hydrolase